MNANKPQAIIRNSDGFGESKLDWCHLDEDVVGIHFVAHENEVLTPDCYESLYSSRTNLYSGLLRILRKIHSVSSSVSSTNTSYYTVHTYSNRATRT